MAQTGEQSSKETDQNNGTTSVGTSSVAPTGAATPAQQSSLATTQPEHDDKDFDPSVEALIDEVDDERTLEEEEAIAGDNATAVQNELDDLKRESEMPIEELLAHYERMRGEAVLNQEDEEEEDDEDDDYDDEEDVEDESEEVSKRQETVSTVNKCTGEQFTQQLLNQTDERQQQQKLHQQPRQLQTPKQQQQVNPTFSNSRITSQSPQPHLQHTTDTSIIDISCNQTAAAILGDQQAFNPIQLQLAREQNQSIFPTSINEVQHSSIECIDGQQPTNIYQISDDQNTIQATARHKHSMTEFLVDSGTAADGMFKTLLDYDLDDSDDLDEDYSFTDDEYGDDEREWRRVIHIGSEYQADVPDNLAKYEIDLPPYENEDTLVWSYRPELTQEQISEYLKLASMISKRNDISISPASVPKISEDNTRLYKERTQEMGTNSGFQSIEQNYENMTIEIPPENSHDVYMSQSRKRLRIDSELEQENAVDGINQPCVELNRLVNPVRDDNSNSLSQENRPELSTEEYFQGEEQLLYLLLQCNYNFEEALRRRRLDPFKYYISEPMSLWSQDECLGFEHGLRIYGKNFHLIRENKVPTRSRAEVVSFYYLWKKSERHDVYTNQYKLDRKRCLSHPGTTDYMDKFIEDNESALNASSSTPTPTPTESTVEINQISDIHHGINQSISICNTVESRPIIQCTNLPDAIPRSKDKFEMNSGTNDSNKGQGNSVYVDSDTAI